MPDVSRSDSQRSDVSLSKPRVSFNRDVHVKRIVPRSAERVVGAPNGDGTVRYPIRKERLEKSEKELEDEAAKVLKQAGKIKCVASSNRGATQEKYYTLPNRRKGFIGYDTFNKKRARKNSLEFEVPPKKPPRSFVSSNDSKAPRPVYDIFKRKENDEKPKKSNLRRSVSDATNVKSKIFKEKNKDETDCVSRSDVEETRNKKRNLKKKQLSPIIELQQREDYFSKFNENNKATGENNKENLTPKTSTGEEWSNPERKESATETLKKYIDEIDEQLFKETGIRVKNTEEKNPEPEIVVIDVDEAEQISRSKNSKSYGIGKKLRSLTARKNFDNSKIKKKDNVNEKFELEAVPTGSPNPKVKKTIKKLELAKQNGPKMMHSSQKPAEKPPLTKGRTVDTMVKRLSSDSPTLPPPKTNILVTPNVSVQHNSNQPFSYTRGVSPEKYNGNDTGCPVIYAQVVCANGASGPSKQTVHTVFTSNIKKHPHYSDSDEGLGYEEHSNRKYSPLQSHFPKKYDGQYISELERDEYFMEAEEPSTNPKIRATYFNGYSYDNVFSDVERGRADGMDAKRRESLSESIEIGTPRSYSNGNNAKSDWSARRDLLESRINRRLSEKAPKETAHNNMFASETVTKYYKNKSESPVSNSGLHTDLNVDRYITESRSKRYDRKDEVQYIANGRYPFEQEITKNQINETRASPVRKHFQSNHLRSNDRFNAKMERQQRLSKDRSVYQSNPEIYDDTKEPHLEGSYHDSLRRDKRIYRSEKYLDHNENERKDRFGDSGIENDIRRDCVEFRAEPRRMYGIKNAESEDEGFASSLLIASERQHTDEAVNARKVRGDYEYDAPYEIDEYEYRKRKTDFIPRERSIDDGSHYDPRIDKNFENERKMAVKKPEKKLPKAEKRSGLEKVKQLFVFSSRKKEKQTMVKEEDLRSRYKEYRGSTERLEPQIKKREIREVNASYDYRNRSRLPTPSPEPQKNGHVNELTNGHISDSNGSHSWFKSLDRLSRKKTRKDEMETFNGAEEELTLKSPPAKNLRFFGDSLRQKNIYNSRPRTNLSGRDKIKSQSTRDLHNISEETKSSRQGNTTRGSHKSMLNVSESDRETNRSMKSNMKPPISPSHRSRDPPRKDERSRRSKNEVSSLESSTEGDSSQQSQQSQRSIVYLHAATVGDIPGPGFLRTNSRAASREELTSNPTKIQPRVKTLSRSFSMLAPWKPKHHRESVDIDYSQYSKAVPLPKNGKYEQKVSKNGTSRNSGSSTLKKKAQETRRSNQNISTLNNHRSRSKENISSSQTLKRSKDEPIRTSSSTLYKKKDRLPRENSRYSKERDDKRFFSKSASVESLGGHVRSNRAPREDLREVSRSVSMPRDPEKSAGWFKMGRKNKNISSQRL